MRLGMRFGMAGWLAAALGCGLVWLTQAEAATPAAPRDPCLGAIVVSLDGTVLLEDRADTPCHPASVTKLMDLLLILEQIQAGKLALTDQVSVTAAASTMGGSQVYLKEGETFAVDDLLYALMIQSANDAAVALAIKVAGSTQAFVARMNARAESLGMTGTRFTSVHGLPAPSGQASDVSTPRDLSLLARAVLKHPDALRYTSTRERGFRDNTFIMRTHNNLLGSVTGCDGLKTGFFRRAGFSIVATAEREGRRVIAVVVGSASRQARDKHAAELIEAGFAQLPEGLTGAPAGAPLQFGAGEEADDPDADADAAPAPESAPARRGWGVIIFAFVGGWAAGLALGLALGARRR